jgi:hypothetical protein
MGPEEPHGVRLGVVRGISYGLFGRPDGFVPAARELGAGLVRAYLYWGQVEPEPGRYSWETVDALLGQFDGDPGALGTGGELWVTVCSSSPWATRQATDFLPPSPARDPAAYERFLRHLVRHCSGRVRYWQCDNEPSNTGLLWAGTAEEYVAQLATMARVVRDADPDAAVVLGGCGYDVFSSPEGSEPRRFFDHLLDAGRDAFDLFDAHLYGDPARIPDYLDTARRMMRVHGYEKPIVAGEHGGPILFEFPAAESVAQQILAGAFASAPEDPRPAAQTQSTGELAARAGQDTPERRAMTALYERMPELPGRLQMFMADCPPDLSALRDRINCRQLVMRTLLALAGGVRRTAYWNLAPEVPGPTDPLQLMHLMFGKLPLLAYEGRQLRHRHPAAETFALLADQLAGVERVTRVESAGGPTLYAFEVQRAGRGPLLVLWEHRDAFDGENAPPVPVDRPWSAPTAVALDAFGAAHPAEVGDGRLRLEVSDTPLFVSA